MIEIVTALIRDARGHVLLVRKANTRAFMQPGGKREPGEDDLAALRRSGEVLAGREEEILDVWYGFVGANPHLLAAFTGPDGQPDQAYLAAVRRRFGRWIGDTARATFDQAWLDYQHEIGLRHHRAKKQTDAAMSRHWCPSAICSCWWCRSRRR